MPINAGFAVEQEQLADRLDDLCDPRADAVAYPVGGRLWRRSDGRTGWPSGWPRFDPLAWPCGRCYGRKSCRGDVAMSDNSTAAQKEWVSCVLDVSASSGGTKPGGGGAPPVGVVAYRKALLDLGETRERVTTQVRDLADEIADTLPAQAEVATRVADMIEEFCDEIGDTIDHGINALDDDRGKQNEVVKREVLGLIGKVSANKLVAHVDRNPIKPLQIAASLSAALQRVADTVV